jgi:hypothetical protein
MKAVVCLLLCLFACSPLGLQGGEKLPDKDKDALPIPKDKWDLKLLEKKYPIKVKSISFDGSKSVVKLLVEYLEDDPDSSKVPFMPKCVFYFFDGDNVALEAIMITAVEGMMTKTKGDAFRYVLTVSQKVMKEAKKVQVREK